MLESFSRQLALEAAIIVVGFAAIAVWSALRWRKLKPTLFADQAANSSVNQLALIGPIRSGDILRMIRNWLAGQGSTAASGALEALSAIEGAEAVDKLFGKALETDDVASLLVCAENVYIYVLAVPDRYENARALGRYRGFADGWRAHLAALRDRIGAGPSSAPVVAFLFFLDPNRGESAVLLSFADKDEIFVPTVLAQTNDRALPASGAVNLSMEFRLAA